MPRDCMADIESYFDLLFAWRIKKIKDIVVSFCNLEGYAINEEMCCYFSPEWQEHGLAYFGEGKVLFDFHAPAVDGDKQIIISYQEFYEIVRRHCSAYAKQHPEEKEEILRLLARLKKRLGAGGGRGAAMMLRLAKWCAIIPLFVHALCPAAVLIVMAIDSLEIHDGPLLDITIGYLFTFVAWISFLLSVFATPVLAALGIVLSAVLVSRKERKAMKFLVLSCADIIISALLYWGIL